MLAAGCQDHIDPHKFPSVLLHLQQVAALVAPSIFRSTYVLAATHSVGITLYVRNDLLACTNAALAHVHAPYNLPSPLATTRYDSARARTACIDILVYWTEYLPARVRSFRLI